MGTAATQPLLRYPPEIIRHKRRPVYRSPTGELLPPISSILSATQPDRDRIALARWRKQVGQEEANRISRASSLRGRLLHQRIERYLSGQPLEECPASIQPWRDSLKPFLREVDRVLLVEGAVFHTLLGYAGTLDAIAHYQDEVCLFDWKTANHRRKDEYLTNNKLQVVALWGAIAATYGLRLRRAVMAIALPEQAAQLVWLEERELEQWWCSWLKRLEQWSNLVDNQ